MTGESGVSAGARGRGLDLKRKMGRPGDEWSSAGAGQRAWRAAVPCLRVPEGK